MKYIYKVKRLKNVKFVKDCFDGYKISPKIKDFNVNSITLYDSRIISYYVEKNFLIKFKKLLELLKNDDEGADQFVLTQIDALEYIILNEYKNFLSIEEIKSMLKDLYLIKQKILGKLMAFNNSPSLGIKSR